jgi:hypothetical protein
MKILHALKSREVFHRWRILVMKFEILFSLYLENPGHEVLMIFVDCRGIFEGSHELFTN